MMTTKGHNKKLGKTLSLARRQTGPLQSKILCMPHFKLNSSTLQPCGTVQFCYCTCIRNQYFVRNYRQINIFPDTTQELIETTFSVQASLWWISIYRPVATLWGHYDPQTKCNGFVSSRYWILNNGHITSASSVSTESSFVRIDRNDPVDWSIRCRLMMASETVIWWWGEADMKTSSESREL